MNNIYFESIKMDIKTKIFNISNDIFYLMVNFFNIKSFYSIRCTSKEFNDIFEYIPPEFIKINILKNINLSKKIYQTAYENKEKLENQYNFLIDSLKELENVLQKHLICNFYSHQDKQTNDFLRELFFISNLLEESLKIIEDIVNFKKIINESFDIIDFSIRRYTEEMIISFPLTENMKLGNITWEFVKKPLNEEAVNIWTFFFGNVMFVPFDDFWSCMENCMPKISNYKKPFKFFYNLPKDNFMTCYRFQVLLEHFGPWSSLTDNFIKIACNAPFVGLVNSQSANKFIEGLGYYIIRFSRKTPSCLTLSFYNQRGYITHCRTTDEIKIKNLILRKSNLCIFPSKSKFRENTYQIEKISEYIDMKYCNLLDSCYNQDQLENNSSIEDHVSLENSLDNSEPNFENFLSKTKFKIS